MATKLKLILRRIHWSLVLRAAVFSCGWLLFPFWAFFLIAVYFYLVPIFQPRKLVQPFLLLIFFAAVEPKGPPLAIFFAVNFYLILGIKDLILINRKPAYEILVLLLSFLMFVWFFDEFGGGVSLRAALYGLAMVLIFSLLARGFLRYEATAEEKIIEKRRGVAIGTAGLLLLQFCLAVIFLPINFLYQAAILFLAATLELEFVSDYLGGHLTRQGILINTSVFLVIITVILGSVSWGL